MNKIALTAAIALGLSASPVFAEPSSAGEVVRQIIERCERDMGTYGAWMVKACVDRDREAMTALAGYPDETVSIITRCTAHMGTYGWGMVKACADRDIEAADALTRY